jgi:hypothetical protein
LEARDRFGASIAVGHGWVAVGAPGEVDGVDGAMNRPPNSTAGEVDVKLVFPGAANGLSLPSSLGITRTIHGNAVAGLGLAASAGDFNCDGLDDVATGAPLDGPGGRVYVSYASGGALPSEDPVVLAQGSQAGMGLGGADEAGDIAGQALAVGDFNGDGCDDLAVGVPGEDLQVDIRQVADAGSIRVKWGSATGLGGYTLLEQGSDGLGDLEEAGDYVGLHMVAGDLTGDGRDDLVVGVPEEDFPALATPDNGIIIVKPGPLTGPSTDTVVLSQGGLHLPDLAERGDRLGAALAIGDFNGDGLEDLAAAAPSEGLASTVDAGAVFVKFGPTADWPSSGNPSDVQVLAQGAGGLGDQPEAYDQVGKALASGDLDGDGVDDLAVGVPGETNQGPDCYQAVFDVCEEGRVSVVLGQPQAGFGGVAEHRVIHRGQVLPGSAQQHERLGEVLAIGDAVGSTEFADLLLGSPAATVAGLPEAGEVLLVEGGAGGFTGRVTIHRQSDDEAGLDSYAFASARTDSRQPTPVRSVGLLTVLVESDDPSLPAPDPAPEWSSPDVAGHWRDLLWEPGRSISDFFLNASEGRLEITDRGVIGPITSPEPCDSPEDDPLRLERSALQTAADEGFLTAEDLERVDANADNRIYENELAILIVKDCWGVDLDSWGSGATNASVRAQLGDRDDANVRRLGDFYPDPCWDITFPNRGAKMVCGSLIRSEELTNYATIAHELSHLEIGTRDLYLGADGVSDCSTLNLEGYGCDLMTLMGPTIFQGDDSPELVLEKKGTTQLDPVHKLGAGWITPRVIDLATIAPGQRFQFEVISTSLSARSISHGPLLICDSGRYGIHDPIEDLDRECFVIESRWSQAPFDEEIGDMGNGVSVWNYNAKDLARRRPAINLIRPFQVGEDGIFTFGPGEPFHLSWQDDASTTDVWIRVVDYEDGRALVEMGRD